jgi:thioredoxin reductase (NADPH)
LQKAKIGLEKEGEFNGKGISYCANCDARFYKNKIVGVAGGGNSALTAALLLSEFAKKVYIFYRQGKFFRAENEWVKGVEDNQKIESVFNTIVTRLEGKKKLEGIEIETSGVKKEIKLDGLFVEIGGISNIKLAKLLGIELDGNFIKVDKEQRTNIEGVFAAGDVTNNPLKQIVTACGEGAIAAFEVYKEYIKERKKK